MLFLNTKKAKNKPFPLSTKENKIIFSTNIVLLNKKKVL